MNKFLFREKDKALNIENKGFLGKYIRSDMYILGKYYKSIGLSKKEAKKRMIDCFKKTTKDNGLLDIYEDLLSSILSKAYQKDSAISQVEDILIFREELDYINGLSIRYSCKKILFTLMIYKKIEFKLTNGKCNMNYFSDSGYKRTNFRDMYGSATKLDETVFELSKYGLLQNGYNSDIKLLFMENIECLEKTDVVYRVDVFEKCALYFDMYNDRGSKIKPCECCGLLFKPKSNSAKYCKECAKEVKMEQDRGYYRKKAGKYEK